VSAAGTLYIAGGGTGGHLYPGLAIADALIAQRPELDIMFIGAQRGIERVVLPTTRWRHELLDLHPLYRSAPWQNWKTVRGMLSAVSRISALQRDKPAVGVLGTGGYAAGALLAHARLHRIPYFLQEQNALAGLTVRAFSGAARATYVGFPEAVASLPAPGRTRALDTGNPITPPPAQRESAAAARARWMFPDTCTHVVLVFGGSQGSRALNDATSEVIASGLPAGWGLLWITGRSEYERLAHLASDRVRMVAYQQPMADAYAVADIAIARAGAMSTAELCAWGIPMVLIPLPTAAGDHQSVNARALQSAGAARIVPQAELSMGALTRALTALCTNTDDLAQMATRAVGRARTDASHVIARHILASLRLTSQ
jgi:UDP-N-acetylglucosamine--N-acetylmuramyl-(pentapeptide) pyrophosphoryl-undecaprenol N-acetylglucosamine transferase